MPRDKINGADIAKRFAKINALRTAGVLSEEEARVEQLQVLDAAKDGWTGEPLPDFLAPFVQLINDEGLPPDHVERVKELHASLAQEPFVETQSVGSPSKSGGMYKMLVATVVMLAVFGGGWFVTSDWHWRGAASGSKASNRMPEVTVNSIGMKFVSLSPGSFEMGCTHDQAEYFVPSTNRREVITCEDNELPAHTVTLTRGFQIQTTEVTQGQYHAVMGKNPSEFLSCGLGCPVEKVKWEEAIKFANALSEKEGLTPAYSDIDRFSENTRWDKSANGYRLPTEAEWEYAARAGEPWIFSGSNEFNDVAWTLDTELRSRLVGTKQPNGWGLYDMSGSVTEWCWDWYHPDIYGGRIADPVGARNGSQRVARGGSIGEYAFMTTVFYRFKGYPAKRYSRVGFRLVRTSP